MKPHTALVLGAGFSKPAGGPLMRELFEPAAMGASRANQTILREVAEWIAKGDADTAQIEGLFTDVWRQARTAGDVSFGSGRIDASEALKQLTIHLASVCGDVRIRRGTRLWQDYIDYVSVLYDESRTLEVVTFNYDLLLEQILDDTSLRYDYGDIGDLRVADANRRRALTRSGAHVRVSKVHGSANWGFCQGCVTADSNEGLMVAFESAYIPSRRTTCPWCQSRLLESGIVLPVHGKAGETTNMRQVWKRARRVLSRADEVCIIGYSLPTADAEAASLLGNIRPDAVVTVVCGPQGTSPTLARLFPNCEDTKLYLEEFFVQTR